ncbi:MAG: iron ABC transporter permease [Lachnospiraceae bacterium]|nr:iron ABC transporter permease [Lachnospiraceae bacterium]
MKISKKLKILFLIILSIVSVSVAMGMGSVSIPLKEQLSIIGNRLFGLSTGYNDSNATILLSIRIPRVLTAFFVGGALAIAGVVTQSILQNPLASSYTLGVSSGAALGAALITVFEISIPVLGILLLPVGGFAGGMLAVLFVMLFSKYMDNSVSSHTIILVGMIVSMFTNAVITLLAVLFSRHEHHIISWTLGSFNGKRWYHALILAIAGVIAVSCTLYRHMELDIMSFGDENAKSIGVNVSKIKYRQLILAALITGISVCFTGTIGFVDLIAPHVSRKYMGATHKAIIPASFFFGGILMTLADLFARTLIAPLEIPVGAVTALIGAPFFMYIYFNRRATHEG